MAGNFIWRLRSDQSTVALRLSNARGRNLPAGLRDRFFSRRAADGLRDGARRGVTLGGRRVAVKRQGATVKSQSGQRQVFARRALVSDGRGSGRRPALGDRSLA